MELTQTRLLPLRRGGVGRWTHPIQDQARPHSAMDDTDDAEPPRPFGHPTVPKLVVKAGRAYRHWRAKGPRLGDYNPASTLELPVTLVDRACVPAVNFHAHLGRWLSPDGSWMEQDVARLLDLMASCNIASTVNLDGRWGRELEDNLDRYDRAHPGKFFTFCHVDWRLLEQPDGPGRLAKSLERSVSSGARGLKVWKDLGLKVTAQGRLVMPDDPRLAPLWETAGALGVPVLWHVADPVSFFQPVDRRNERLEELLRWRQHQAGGKDGFRRLLASIETVLASHPTTRFVAAHGLYPENVGHLAAMFERYPNLFVDIAWVHLQLGRQPRAARQLLIDHPDRVLFGTDVFPLRQAQLRIYFRFLETADEYFSYTDEPLPSSGRWNIYGLNLPTEALENLYSANANVLLGNQTSRALPT